MANHYFLKMADSESMHFWTDQFPSLEDFRQHIENTAVRPQSTQIVYTGVGQHWADKYNAFDVSNTALESCGLQ